MAYSKNVTWLDPAELQVEISIEMMVESSQEEAYEPVYSLKRGSLAKVSPCVNFDRT